MASGTEVFRSDFVSHSAVLGVHPETVAKHTAGLAQSPDVPAGDSSDVAEGGPSKPVGTSSDQNRPSAPTGSDALPSGSDSLPNAPAESEAERKVRSGPASFCAVHRELIYQKLQHGVSAQRFTTT